MNPTQKEQRPEPETRDYLVFWFAVIGYAAALIAPLLTIEHNILARVFAWLIH